MIKLATLLLPLLYALFLWRYSAWRLSQELDKRSVPLSDPQLAPLIDRMAATLAVDEIPVNLYEVAQINGLAAPDGRIFLTRGMYEAFRENRISGEEVASVIAHELGHVALGHSRRRMIDFTGHSAIRIALTAVLGRFLPGIGAPLAGFLTRLLAARLSRRDEFAADAWASALLIKTGIGTNGQKSLLARLEQLAGTRDAAPAWLMSHPRSAERIAAIEANERHWQAPDTAPPPS